MRAKRFLVVFVLCCTLLVCNGYAAWDYVTLTVDVDAELVYNNHVGDDWWNSYCVIYNGHTYSCAIGRSVTIFYKLGAPLEIYTYICETDDVNSDVGTYSTTEDYLANEICDGAYSWVVHHVYVTENDGRYKGNAAQWDVTYTLYVDSSPTPKPTAIPKSTPHPAKKTITSPPAGTTKGTPKPKIPSTSSSATELTDTPEAMNTPVIDFSDGTDTEMMTSEEKTDGSATKILIFVVGAWLIAMGSFIIEEKGMKTRRSEGLKE